MSIRFLHVGDTHLGPNEEFEFPNCPGLKPYVRAQQLVRWINSIPAPIDFVVHTGDVSHNGHLTTDDGQATRFGAELLGGIRYPLHVLVGNHDNRTAMREAFGEPNGVEIVAKQPRRTYWFEIEEHLFIVLDARDGREIDPRGKLCQSQLEFLTSKLSSSNAKSATIFTHYIPLKMQSTWIDESMLIENGEELHRILCGSSIPVAGVFHGHIHRGTHRVIDGILYSSVGGTVMQFEAWPKLAKPAIDASPILFANYVQVTDRGAIVQQLTQCMT